MQRSTNDIKDNRRIPRIKLTYIHHPSSSLSFAIIIGSPLIHRQHITLNYYVSFQVFLGALPLAIELVNHDPSLLPGYVLKYQAFDIGRNFSVLPIKYAMIEVATKCVRIVS